MAGWAGAHAVRVGASDGVYSSLWMDFRGLAERLAETLDDTILPKYSTYLVSLAHAAASGRVATTCREHM